MKLLEGPGCTICDHRILVCAQLLERWTMLPIPAVSHRDHRIPAQAAQLGPAHRRTAKFFAKLLGFHFREPLQGGIHESFTRLKLGSLRGRSSAVPRADILTDVAAK